MTYNGTLGLLPDSPEWQAYLQRMANQRLLLEQASAAAAARRAERALAQERAAALAEELLLLMLDDEQTRQYRELHYIDLTSPADGRRYRIITRGSAEGNVKILDEYGIAESSWCAAPRDMPLHDKYLGQLLLLAASPEAFFAVANRY